MTVNLSGTPSKEIPAAEGSILDRLHAEYHRYSRAMCEKDLHAVQSLLSDDFVWTLEDGRSLNRHETLSAIAEHFDMALTLDPMQFNILKWETTENEVTVEVCETSRGVRNQAEPEHFNTVETVKEVWQIDQAVWQIKTAEILQSQTLTMPVGQVVKRTEDR